MITDDDDEEVEEEDEEEDPELETVMIQHNGAVNRMRVCWSNGAKQSAQYILQVARGVQRCLVAAWSEQGLVNVWDTSPRLILLDSPSAGAVAAGSSLRGHQDRPLFTFSGHTVQRTAPVPTSVVYLPLFPDGGLWPGLVSCCAWPTSHWRLLAPYLYMGAQRRGGVAGWPSASCRALPVSGGHSVEPD